MNLNMGSIKRLLVHTMIVSFCCLILGLFRYGTAVFDFRSLASVFLFYGLVSAPIFYALRDHNVQVAVVVFCLIIIFDEFLLMYPITFHNFIYGCLLAFARAVSIYVFYKKFYLKNARLLWNPLILAVLLTVCTLIVLLIFGEYSIATSTFWFNSLHQLAPRFLAALGLGIGFWLADHPAIIRIVRTSPKQ